MKRVVNMKMKALIIIWLLLVFPGLLFSIYFAWLSFLKYGFHTSILFIIYAIANAVSIKKNFKKMVKDLTQQGGNMKHIFFCPSCFMYWEYLGNKIKFICNAKFVDRVNDWDYPKESFEMAETKSCRDCGG